MITNTSITTKCCRMLSIRTTLRNTFPSICSSKLDTKIISNSANGLRDILTSTTAESHTTLFREERDRTCFTLWEVTRQHHQLQSKQEEPEALAKHTPVVIQQQTVQHQEDMDRQASQLKRHQMVVPWANAGGPTKAQMQAVEDQISELRLNNDTLDREREFYFGKLIKIEEMLQKKGMDQDGVGSEVIKILQASEEE